MKIILLLSFFISLPVSASQWKLVVTDPEDMVAEVYLNEEEKVFRVAEEYDCKFHRSSDGTQGPERHFGCYKPSIGGGTNLQCNGTEPSRDYILNAKKGRYQLRLHCP